MALTRKFLKAMGIEEEKIEQIIDAHGETVTALKEERDTYKADAEKLSEIQKKLKTAEEKLAEKGEGETVPKADFDKMKKEYDDYKAQISDEKEKTAKEHAFRELLKEAGVSEKRIDSIVKVTNLEEVKLDENGKIADAKERLETVKTEWADFIPTTETRGANTATPPANNGNGTGKTKEEILAIKDGSVRRAEMAKNPHLFGLDKN